MVTRIGGLASGMDIDTLVSDLMKAERIPLDKLTQKKQTLEWQRDDYRSMNTLLKELDDMLFLNKDSIGREATFLKKSVSSTDDSKVTAQAINAQANFSTQINVKRLATSESWKTTGNVVKDFNKVTSDLNLTFKVTEPGASTPRMITDPNNPTQKIEEVITISLKKDDTIDDVISKINSSSLGISAMKENVLVNNNGTPDDYSDDIYEETIVFTNRNTGAGSKIEMTNSATNDFMASLGFSSTPDGTEFVLSSENSGQDAIVEVNGFEMKKTSNSFTINGVEYTAKAVTTSAVTVSSTTDVDSILDTIVKFVDKYNEVIEKINGKLTEERYRDYQPLTEEQKKAMDEKTIELWEEKAKSGLLKNDSVLSSSLSKMRVDLYSPVTNSEIVNGFSMLSEIGITTTSYSERGKLTIDEDVLREKIQENPTAIYKLFNAGGGTDDSTEITGLAKRLRTTIDNTIESIEEKAGNTSQTNQQFVLGKNLISVDKQIDRFQDRLMQIEDRYWRQFTAMEKAIQQSNQQSMYLMQQFGMQ
ncbi:flagellar hook-associated protein 2 [Metabacillus sp. YM-086]|uniref:flagellar hook-associated protein 2 n=1 Tax=Metabacillus sp. YM-086 TaxID=3341729 RepID=UPI003A8526E0